MTDNEIIKALECCFINSDCNGCPLAEPQTFECLKNACTNALDLINRQKAENERLHKLQKPTETSGFKIANGKVVFYTNILNGYRHEYKDIEEVVKELNLMLQSCYKCDDVVSHYKGNLNKAKSEAIREFAERLKEKALQKFDWNEYVEVEEIDNLVKEMAGDE